MAFDKKWEKIFSERAWGKYPCEEVIRITAQNFYKFKNRKYIKFLDLGCGGGATTWYLAKEGFDVYGIDGSPSAIKQTYNYLQKENLKATLKVSDFVHIDFENNTFDAVYDLGAIQHNKMNDIKKIYKEIVRVLKPKGLFFSKCINNKTSGQEKAKTVEKNSFIQLPSINNEVLVHLFSINELKKLLAPFDNTTIDSTLNEMTTLQHRIGHYLVSGFKKG